MPGLRDIAAKLRRTVVIAGEEVPVRGLTAAELADLIAEHPQFGRLMRGEVDSDAMARDAPACVAAMIAAGTNMNGHAPTDEELADARALPGIAVLDLLSAIAELTLPRAVTRPFVDLVSGPADDGSLRAPDTR